MTISNSTGKEIDFYARAKEIFDRIPPFTRANPQSDFGLSAEQLRNKYDPDGGDGHPQHTRADWRKAVAEEAVISGYWVWVRHSIKENL